MLTLLLGGLALAATPTYPQLAASDGYEAVGVALSADLAGAKNEKRRDETLAARDLAGLRVPVRAVGGAELSLPAVTPAGACAFDGTLRCTFGAAAPAGASVAYEAHCVSDFGLRAPLALEASSPRDGALLWRTDDLMPCLALGASRIELRPAASRALDGVGQGDEYHAPELVQLSYAEVWSILETKGRIFERCVKEQGTWTGAHKLVVGFRIAEDGHVAEARLDESTLPAEDPVAVCVLDSFRRFRFPPPMGGYDAGAWPVTLMR